MAREAESVAQTIVRDERVCSGSPIIAGTRVRVSDIVSIHNLWAREMVIERICRSLPHLAPEQVREALRYYEEHREEIDREMAEEEAMAVS